MYHLGVHLSLICCCSMFVFGLYPPQLQFEIKIKVEKVSYTKKSGEPVYETIEELVLGPSQRISTSNDFRVGESFHGPLHSKLYIYWH